MGKIIGLRSLKHPVRPKKSAVPEHFHIGGLNATPSPHHVGKSSDCLQRSGHVHSCSVLCNHAYAVKKC